MDYKKFFDREPTEVAQDLIGRLLIRRLDSGIIAAEIRGVGAYSGGADKSGPRKGMFYDPGKVFLMPHRGHHLLNIATGGNGPTCVEIREIFGKERIEGSGAIRTYLEISETYDGKFLGDEVGFYISDDIYRKQKVKKSNGNADNCKGFFSFA